MSGFTPQMSGTSKASYAKFVNEETDRRYDFAILCRNEGRFNEAITAFKKALDIAPTDYDEARIHNQIAMIYEHQNKFYEAKGHYKAAINRGWPITHSVKSESYYQYGLLYERQKNLDKALANYKQAKDLGHKQAEGNFCRIQRERAFPILLTLSVFTKKRNIRIPKNLREKIQDDLGIDFKSCIKDYEETKELEDFELMDVSSDPVVEEKKCTLF